MPRDLAFIGYGRDELHAINPRLIPLIAHDRAGFGGGLFTAGLLVLAIVWKAAPSRHAWEALTVAGIVGFGCALGVHYPIGCTDPGHLARAWLAGSGKTACWIAWMRSRVRSTRENRRFSCLEKVPEDFFHGQLGAIVFAAGARLLWRADWGEDGRAGEGRAGEGVAGAGNAG